MKISRRGLIQKSAVGVAVGLTGCTSGQSFQQCSSECFENSQSNTNRQEGTVEYSFTARVPQGRYVVYEINPQVSIGLSYVARVTQGSAVDIYVMDGDEFNRYRDEEDTSFYIEASEQDTTNAEIQTTMPPGDYVIIIDNTYYGEAQPSGEVVVEFEGENSL